MIFITGDTHGRNHFDKLRALASDGSYSFRKDDYVIIAGDFGGLFSPVNVEELLKLYSDLPFSVLFVDGNHENFDLLNAYPVTEWHGGKVHVIKPDIIHLMRGQIYNIEGRSFFTLGGATSVDKSERIAGLNWWREEVPDFDDYREAINNLERANYSVDYIVTHACDERALYYPLLRRELYYGTVYPENAMLNNIEEAVDYGHWYFGHYHVDGEITRRKTALFQNVVRLV